MSIPEPTGNPQPKKPISAGGIALIAIGAFLLLVPGGCALFGFASAIATFLDKSPGAGSIGIVILVISIALALIAYIGLRLIRAGRQR